MSGTKLNLIPTGPLDLIASLQGIKGPDAGILNDHTGMSTAKSMWDFEQCQNVKNSTGQMTHLLQRINCNLKEREHILKEIQNTELIIMSGPYLEPSLDKPTTKIFETVTEI